MSVGQKWLMGSAAIGLLSLFLLSIFGDHGLMEVYRLRDRQQSLAAGNQALARENLRLYRNIERLNRDPAFIESVARNELGMVGAGDIILLPSVER